MHSLPSFVRRYKLHWVVIAAISEDPDKIPSEE